jgi:hypothetical protein
MKHLTIIITTIAVRLLCLGFLLLFLPTVSVAQWSLNIGFAAEINTFNQLNAIIDRNNYRSPPAALPHFNVLSGYSIAMEKDMKSVQFGFRCNRLKQTVGSTANYKTALSYINTQIGINGEWKLCSFLGVGGTLDYNFLNINNSYKTEPNYYTNSNNLLTKNFGSSRAYLHFQKLLNPYFAVSFRPYYQQSFNGVDFTRVNDALENFVQPLHGIREIPKFDFAPQRLKNWGGEITLQMFLTY